MWSRRQFLAAAATTAGVAATGLSALVHANHHKLSKSLPAGTEGSPLIYISPLQSNGALSSCQAEVWFAALGQHLYVVTDNNAWRAQAVRQGLTQARIWVGDVGLWQRSKGKYLELPQIDAVGALTVDPTEHLPVLQHMGRKYASEWDNWGPKFHNGLINGKRVMLRYSQV